MLALIEQQLSISNIGIDKQCKMLKTNKQTNKQTNK